MKCLIGLSGKVSSGSREKSLRGISYRVIEKFLIGDLIGRVYVSLYLYFFFDEDLIRYLIGDLIGRVYVSLYIYICIYIYKD